MSLTFGMGELPDAILGYGLGYIPLKLQKKTMRLRMKRGRPDPDGGIRMGYQTGRALLGNEERRVLN